MKIGFFGTAEFAVPALQALAKSVCLVVSQPDRPAGRGMKLQGSPVKEAAQKLGIEVQTPEKCRNAEFVESIRNLNLDVLVVAAYGQILPQSLLEAAAKGAINLHGSILPLYRGAAPIQRSILNGDTETGVTLMQMDKGMDTGAVIAIQKCPILAEETYGMVEQKLGDLAAKMCTVWIPKIVAGDYQTADQNPEEATYAPKVERSEGELQFERNVITEYNRFRAFTPSPGAYVITQFGRIKLLELSPCEAGGIPGTIVQKLPVPAVAFEGGSLCLDWIAPEGKPRMRGSDWLNGVRLQIGDSLRSIG